MHKTLHASKHFSRWTSQNIYLKKGTPVFVEGGARRGRLCHGTMAQWPVQAWSIHHDFFRGKSPKLGTNTIGCTILSIYGYCADVVWRVSVVKTFAQNKDDRKRVKQAIESAHLLTSSVSRLPLLWRHRHVISDGQLTKNYFS